MIGLKLFNCNHLSARAVVRILNVVQATSPQPLVYKPWFMVHVTAGMPSWRTDCAISFSVLIATRLVPQSEADSKLALLRTYSSISS